jgi:hypothetical protein
VTPALTECATCGFPGLRPNGHADWCERTAAWLASIEPPSVVACRASAAASRAARAAS